MLIDFPTPAANVKKLLYADDVTIYTTVRTPMSAEVILQPVLEEIGNWGRKWNFKFSGEKSAQMVFTRSHKPGQDPLLFIRGQRIRPVSHFKLLGLTFDYGLRWHKHIAEVTSSCSRLKNLFSIIAKAQYGPPIRTLITLYKSLVQSRIDYGSIAYGAASKTSIERVNIASRSILRVILGARPSTPIEVLYSETGTTPVYQRRQLLATRYLLKLNQSPSNSTYSSVFHLFHNVESWPTYSTPCVVSDLCSLKNLGMDLFPSDPNSSCQQSARSPFDPPLCDILWFPLTKSQAVSNRVLVRERFQVLLGSFPASIASVFTDGSSSKELERTSSAIYSADLNFSRSWLLTVGSSVFTAESIAILQALKIVYEMESTPEQVVLFSDSKATLLAIISNGPPSNHHIVEIHNLLRCLKSIGTKVTLVWVPSHTGIHGNEMADQLAADECSSPTGNRIFNKLTASENLSAFQKTWSLEWIQRLKQCIKPSVQVVTKIRRIDWFFAKDRRTSICLHRLRSGHNSLNKFRNRIDPECDPLCRRGCEEVEDAQHVLIDCPALENPRRILKHFLLLKNLPFDLPSVLGLNLTFPVSTQFKIRNLMSKFLSQSGLISSV